MPNKFWNENAEQWTRVIDSGAIASRKITGPAILEILAKNKIDSVLDIGCGEGWLARALPAGTTYVGIDGSALLIKEARTRSKHSFEVVSYIDLSHQKWQSQQLFKGVVFNFSLLDQDLVPILKSTHEFLAANGSVIIQTLHPLKMPKYEDAWFIEDFKATEVNFKETMPWFGRTFSSWVDLFRQSNFDLEQIVEPQMGDTPASIIFILKRLEK